ncbi:MAG TPA: patatin-like phospholipase family protein [Treponemataceae bacterium]|nr:patatin-like phospholipase family protein [Treponemataceae bacterium]
MKKNYFIHLIFVRFLFIGLPLFSLTLTPEKETPTSNNESRPTVAVVLAGGGARGFAHIPVLQILDEENIPIDMIIGTSAGSIVGGLYCAGYTPNQIMQKLGYLDWSVLFQDEVTSPFEKTLGEHSSYTTPFALKLATDKNSIDLQMGSALLTGQRAYEQLKSLTMRIPSNTDFDTLATAFRAITVDLLTGEILVLSKGDIAESMRASLSIPGIFQPYLLNGHYCIDGMARNNNPIDIAHNMGYDIIISVDFGNLLKDNYSEFERNPLVAVTQMLVMEQSIKNLQNYQFADLVIIPDYGNYSLIDYDSSVEIYNTAKTDVEQYRPHIKEIKKKIENWNQDELTKKTPAAIIQKKQKYFPANYFDNPLPNPSIIVTGTENPATAKYAKNYFDKLKESETPFTAHTLKSLSESIYNTGKYDMVNTRILKTKDNEILEINTISKKPKNSVVLFGVDYRGTLAKDSSTEINLITDVQWRGLSGEGSVLSVQSTVLNDFAIKCMYLHPISTHFFMQIDSNFLHDHLYIGSGWNMDASAENLLIRKAKTSLTFGIPLTKKHTFTSGASFNWHDTRQEVSYGATSMSANIYANYTFNALDHTLFPEKGVYFTANNTIVFPIPTKTQVLFFDTVSIDFTSAIPLTNSTSLLLSALASTNIDEKINKRKDLKPIYGFSATDRCFLPQISNRSQYGIHKMTLSAAIQIAPWRQITLLGGKAFFALSIAGGNVWDTFDTITLDGLKWRSSFDVGLRITDAFGLLLRAGAGTTQNSVAPFFSLDIGNIRY